MVPDPIVIEAMAHWMQHCPAMCRRLVKMGPHALLHAVQRARDRQLHVATMMMARVPHLSEAEALRQTRSILLPIEADAALAWSSQSPRAACSVKRYGA